MVSVYGHIILMRSIYIYIYIFELNSAKEVFILNFKKRNVICFYWNSKHIGGKANEVTFIIILYIFTIYLRAISYKWET